MLTAVTLASQQAGDSVLMLRAEGIVGRDGYRIWATPGRDWVIVESGFWGVRTRSSLGGTGKDRRAAGRGDQLAGISNA